MRLYQFLAPNLLEAGAVTVTLPRYSITSDVMNWSYSLGTSRTSEGFVADILSGANKKKTTFSHSGIYKFSSTSAATTQIDEIWSIKGRRGFLYSGIEEHMDTNVFQKKYVVEAVFVACKITSSIQTRVRRSDLYVYKCDFKFDMTGDEWVQAF